MAGSREPPLVAAGADEPLDAAPTATRRAHLTTHSRTGVGGWTWAELAIGGRLGVLGLSRASDWGLSRSSLHGGPAPSAGAVVKIAVFAAGHLRADAIVHLYLLWGAGHCHPITSRWLGEPGGAAGGDWDCVSSWAPAIPRLPRCVASQHGGRGIASSSGCCPPSSRGSRRSCLLAPPDLVLQPPAQRGHHGHLGGLRQLVGTTSRRGNFCPVCGQPALAVAGAGGRGGVGVYRAEPRNVGRCIYSCKMIERRDREARTGTEGVSPDNAGTRRRRGLLTPQVAGRIQWGPQRVWLVVAESGRQAPKDLGCEKVLLLVLSPARLSLRKACGQHEVVAVGRSPEQTLPRRTRRVEKGPGELDLGSSARARPHVD